MHEIRCKGTYKDKLCKKLLMKHKQELPPKTIFIKCPRCGTMNTN